MARSKNAYVQSHISESLDEIAAVRAMHLDTPNVTDAAVFDSVGLLTPRSIMAHGTLLGDEDLKFLASRGACIAHCRNSNWFFGDQPFRCAPACCCRQACAISWVKYLRSVFKLRHEGRVRAFFGHNGGSYRPWMPYDHASLLNVPAHPRIARGSAIKLL